MDAGLFLILVIIALILLHVFDSIMDYVKYKKPKHAKKDSFLDKDDII